jgi:sugar lactone lactonase YvrE
MNRYFCTILLITIVGWLSPVRADELETVVTFDASTGEIPESVTADAKGTLYFSVGSSVRRRTADGQITVFGTLPIAAFALGVKVGPDGCVYTASTSLSATPGAFVWRICTAGRVEQVAALDPTGGPNDLAFDDEGRLFVTDPFLGRIWVIDSDGAARIWLADPLLQGNPSAPVLVFHSQGVNGIAFDRHHHHLYVGNLDFGRILRIPVERDGTSGCPAVYAESPLLVGADGIAFDVRGDLLVAVNAQDRLVSVDSHGDVTSIAQGGLLDAPSSIVFDTSRPDAPHRFFVTSSAFSRAFGFQPGTPRPALLRSTAAHKGLPLP